MASLPHLPELGFVRVSVQGLELAGERLSYREAGPPSAPAVLLLHGIGTHAAGWRYILDALADDYRVIGWNAPGYYLSDPLISHAPTADVYAAVAVALLDALGVRTCHLVGSSFGSMVATALAAEHADRVQSLTLLGASRGQAWLPSEERQAKLRMRAALARAGGFEMAEKRWRQLLGPQPSTLTVDLTKALLKAMNADAYLQAARASDQTDTLRWVNRITVPTQLIVGTADVVNPPEVSAAIHAAIPGSRLTTLDGVGHLPKLEAPFEVSKLLRQHFLRSSDIGAPTNPAK